MKHVRLFSLDSNDAYHYISDEIRVDRERVSNEVKLFWDEILQVIKDIIGKKLNNKKKKIIFYHINNLNSREIALILSKSPNLSEKKHHYNYRNFHKRYQKIVDTIREHLCWSDEFEELVHNRCPEILKSRMVDWIKESRLENPRDVVFCPVCREGFKNRISLMNHFSRRVYYDSIAYPNEFDANSIETDKYSRSELRHIAFVKRHERMVLKKYDKHRYYSEVWAKKLMENKYFHFGMTYIYKLCQKIESEHSKVEKVHILQ